jgi:exopolyphosphatase/guanosine-5'-triphosphate,3'-diphosphate pyrophosphatase
MQTGNIHEIVGRLSQDGPLLEDNAILLMRCVPDRIHTILPGMLIAEVLMRHFHSNSVIYADSGVREGYIYKEILAGK